MSFFFFARTKKNDATAFFSHHRSKKRLFCLVYCRHSLKSEVKRMTVTARSKHSNPREDVCIVKQNNPNNPSHTEAQETKSKILPPPSLLR